MKRPRLKTVLLSISGLLLLALLIVGYWLWTPSAPAPDYAAYKETAKSYDVRVIRDRWGSPHIFGKRDADAAFGLAYAHAEDDWATIEETILFVRGENALVRGKEAAVGDYLVDFLGVWPEIEKNYTSALSPKTRALVEGYADGINLWAAENPYHVGDGVLPVTGKDVVAGFAVRAPFFFGLDTDLKELFKKKAARQVSKKQAALIPRIQPIGSNAMAVAPKRSSDGHTRLMVNSHQPWVGPVAWYEAHVVSEEGWNAVGGVFPGAPLILHGTTPNLGWAFTVNHPDLVDIYKLDVDDKEEPTRYRFDGEWKKFERSESRFRVKLWGPFSFPVSRPVLRSIHGPALVTDHGVYAIRYAGMGDITAIQQWYRMNKATNLANFVAALEPRAIASFNLTYADREGNIGYLYNARFPKRQEGWDWRAYLPGNTRQTLWTESLPFESSPQIWNPESGFVVNSNNTPFRATDPSEDLKEADFSKTLGIETTMTNRARRILALYNSDSAISEEEFLAYKFDIRFAQDSKAMNLVRRIEAMDLPELAEAQKHLAAWSGDTSTSDTHAALAILALGSALEADGEPSDELLKKSLKSAAADLRKHHGRLDVPWGEINRLIRGKQNLPLAGAPDTLHAIHAGYKLNKDGVLKAAGGDSYILYADWDTKGALTVQSIHQFGSASTRKESRHYADQAPIFAQRKLRPVTLDLATLEKEATRDYRPGKD